jgi:hypothetical protein
MCTEGYNFVHAASNEYITYKTVKVTRGLFEWRWFYGTFEGLGCAMLGEGCIWELCCQMEGLFMVVERAFAGCIEVRSLSVLEY